MPASLRLEPLPSNFPSLPHASEETAGMKFVSALAATAILGCGAAFGADPPATPSATPVKHPSLKVCNKQADAKQLTGPARAQFVKDCHAGTPAHAPTGKKS
jgi:psiF repeat